MGGVFVRHPRTWAPCDKPRLAFDDDNRQRGAGTSSDALVVLQDPYGQEPGGGGAAHKSNLRSRTATRSPRLAVATAVVATVPCVPPRD